MIDAFVAGDVTGTDESDAMSNWNDEVPGPSDKGRKPAKSAAQDSVRHTQPKKAAESLPDWNDGAASIPTNAGGGLWQTIRHNRVSQGLLLFLLMLAFLGGLSAFVISQLEQHKMVAMLSIAVTGYEDRAPLILPNALCESDIERIAGTGDAASPGVNASFLRHWTPERNVVIRSWDDLKLQLDMGLNSGKPQGPSRGILRGNHRNQILYLSLHLATRQTEEGRDQAVMLFPESNLYDSSTWVPLSEVFTLVSQWRQTLDQPNDPVNVLVLLDCGKQRLNPYLAISTSRLTSAIQQTVIDLGDKNLFTLVSQSDGQLNWVAPELNGSVFGYAVSQALLANQRDQITLNQFQQCVVNSVAAWTKQFRGEMQRPVFLQAESATSDFPFLAGAKDSVPKPKPLPISQKAVTDLSRSWQKHGELSQTGLWSSIPAEYGNQKQNLLYAEQTVLMGLPPGTVPDLSPSLPKASAAFPTLAMKHAAEKLPTSDLPAQIEVVEQTFLKAKNPAAASEKDPTPKPTLQPWAVREWLLTKCTPDSAGPELDQLRFVDRSLTESAPGVRRTPETVEAQFVRMLAENAPWDSAKDLTLLRKSVGAAISCRFRAEDLVAQLTPDDIMIDSRAHYRIREKLLELDVRRRLAEDLIFSGRAEELTQATKTLQEIFAQVNELATRLANVSMQLQVRDELLGGLPDLLLLYGTVAGSVPESLSPFLASDSRLLAEDWAELKTTSQKTLSEAVESATRDAVNATASSGQPDPDSARFLTAWKALQSAALMGTQREEVRSYAVKYLTAQCDAPEFELKWDSEEPSEEPADEASDRAASCFANLRAYLLAQLRLIMPEDEILKELEQHTGQDAEDLRRIFQHATQLAKGLREDLRKEPAVPLISGNTNDRAYLNLQRTEYVLRLLGPICPEVGSPPLRRTQAPNVPVISLRNDLDRRDILLWQAKRLLDDFWGIESFNDTNHSGSNDSWFERRVTALLDEAAVLMTSHPAAEQDHVVAAEFLGENLSELLVRRSAAAREGVINIHSSNTVLSLPSASPLLTPPAPEATLTVSLAAGSASTGVPEIGGRCVVFEASGDLNNLLPDAAGSANPEGHRAMLDIESLEKNAADFKVRVPAETKLRRLQFQTWFRGHVSGVQLRLADVGEEFATLQSAKPDYGPSQVTVVGDPPNLRPQVMFVLDCSNSMAEVDVPNADGGPDEQRGAVCRAALLKTLSTLESRNFDVGLVLFGHRFLWKNVGTKQAEKWVAAATKLGESSNIPATEWDPDQDVEVAIPLSPFGPTEMDEFRPLLGKIEHKYGTVSPLYRAMETALKEFENAKNEQAPRFLIVLTDGVNQLFKEEARLRDRQFTDVMLVRKALDKTGTMFSKVKCVLVYLQPKEFDKDGENDDQTAFKSLEAEFQGLEKDGRGGLFTAKDPSGVSSMLLNSLDWIEFSIPESNSGRMNLGATIENLPLSPDGDATAFELQVQSRSGSFTRQLELFVEGGEHLEYTFRHKDGSLIIPEYPESHGIKIKPEQVRFLPRFRVKSLLPRVEQDGDGGKVTVPISVQAVPDQEGQPTPFTRRPIAFHAEIRRSNGDAELPPVDKLNDNSHCLTSLCLYDRVFQNGTPVPVIPLQFPKWTKESIRASVDLWFRMSPVPDNEFEVDISLADALDSKFAAPTVWQEGAGLLSVKELYSEMGTEILVRVEQIEQSQYLETRVELSKAADRIERNFFIKPANAVVHRFQFARNNPPDKADVRLRILTAKKFKTLEGTIHATDQATGGPFLVDTSSVE